MATHRMFSFADRMEAIYKAIKHFANKLLHSQESGSHSTHIS